MAAFSAETNGVVVAMTETELVERCQYYITRNRPVSGTDPFPFPIDQIKKGGCIVYDDGRPGHKRVLAMVLAVDAKGMTVQFDDRADTTRIAFSDRGWMDFIEVAP